MEFSFIDISKGAVSTTGGETFAFLCSRLILSQCSNGVYGIFMQKKHFDVFFSKTCVDFEVTHLSIHIVWRLPYRSVLPWYFTYHYLKSCYFISMSRKESLVVMMVCIHSKDRPRWGNYSTWKNSLRSMHCTFMLYFWCLISQTIKIPLQIYNYHFRWQ